MVLQENLKQNFQNFIHFILVNLGLSYIKIVWYISKKKHQPLPSMMGTATIIIPEALHTYFIKNCSNITYQSFLFKIMFVCWANDW